MRFLLVLVGAISVTIVAGGPTTTQPTPNESPANETESPTVATQNVPGNNTTEVSSTGTKKINKPTVPAEKPSTSETPENGNDDQHFSHWSPINPEQVDKFFKDLVSPNNKTVIETDTHRYYNSTIYQDKAAQGLWKDLTANNSVRHEILSNSHMTAATETLKFTFPFYGQNLTKVTIATGGFLSTGDDRNNNMLAVAQYIAPLMANFDIGIETKSSILYKHDDDLFVVEWRSVYLRDYKTNASFTFQAQLHKSGDIVFVYKDVPITIDSIPDNIHPVKVGLSDAFKMTRSIGNRHQHYSHTLFIEYHKIDHKTSDLTNWTAIYYTALRICPMMSSCEECLSDTITQFRCKWCPTSGRCSDGTDRGRESWLKSKCHIDSFSNVTECAAATIPPPLPEQPPKPGKGPAPPKSKNAEALDNTDSSPNTAASSKDSSSGPIPSGVITTVLVIMCLVIVVVGWVIYAYFHPHTTSGQILIRYRPGRFRWRRGEPSYTAAAIHM